MMVQKSPELQNKPFACAVKGCDMTFTNKDHLEWHTKKHEMMLNLGLVNKNNEMTDQTPTPTRFIRNCEEVGLFQDLQNVNPFDEIFKKAADLAKNGVTIEFQPNSDDTLHTPHILPHITENQLQTPEPNQQNDSDCEPFDFTATNNSDSSDIVKSDTNKNKNIKKEIKENILNKKHPVIKVVPFENLIEGTSNKKNNSKENNKGSSSRKEEVRQMNRAAQLRCRKRKKQQWREMEEEINALKEENKRLKFKLKELYQEHSNCTTSNESSHITNASSKITSTTQLPFVIQIIPNAQLSLFPTSTESQEGNITSSSLPSSESIDEKKKINNQMSKEVTVENKIMKNPTFRKIAPRKVKGKC